MDLLTDGGRPKRLLFQRGRWSLEVVRLLAVGNSVFQPHTQRVDGPDAILGFLSKNETGQALLQSTHELLNTVSSEEKRSFDAVEGQWIPSSIAPSYIKELARQKRKSAKNPTAIELIEMRAEMMTLRLSHDRLKQRVKDLERRLATGAFSAPTGNSAVATPSAGGGFSSKVPPATERTDRGLPYDATQQIFVGGGQSPSIPIPAASGSSMPAGSMAPRGGPGESIKPAKRLRLPAVGALTNTLKQALGDDVFLKEAVKTPFNFSGDEAFYVSRLVDDENLEVGALLADHVAAIHMSAALLMLPQAEINAQLKKSGLSEDTSATMSEVFNMLCNTINKVGGNIHTRTTYVEAWTKGKLDWVEKPSRALYLDDSFGGRLALISK